MSNPTCEKCGFPLEDGMGADDIEGGLCELCEEMEDDENFGLGAVESQGDSGDGGEDETGFDDGGLWGDEDGDDDGY